MARQTFNFGPGLYASSSLTLDDGTRYVTHYYYLGIEDDGIPVNQELLAGDVPGNLVDLQIQTNDPRGLGDRRGLSRILIQTPGVRGSFTPGPDLSPAWESYASAIQLSQVGRGSSGRITLKGPAHPDNTRNDADEPYNWLPDNASALVTWANRAGSRNIILTLDDGIPDAISVSATLDGSLAGSLQAVVELGASPLAILVAAALDGDVTGSLVGSVELGAVPTVPPLSVVGILEGEAVGGLDGAVELGRAGPLDLSAWQPVGMVAGNRFRYPGVIVGKTYQVRARHRNQRGVAGEWSAVVERQVGGDLTPPGPVTGLDVDSLPQGFHAKWTNPADKDYASTEVYMGTAPDFASAARKAIIAANHYTAHGLTAGTPVNVWVRAKDRSGNLGPTAGPMAVTPTVAAREGAAIHTGAGVPANSLGADGDLYIRSDGHIWQKASGSWRDTGIDLTETAGSSVHRVASWPPSNSLGSNDDVAIADDGQWGNKVSGSWIRRGDLTGPQGPPGVSVGIQNPGFEDGSVNWTLGSGRTILNSSSQAHTGNYSLRMVLSGGSVETRNRNADNTEYLVEVVPGETVIYGSFWARRSSGSLTVTLQVALIRADGRTTISNHQIARGTATSSWKKFEGRYAIPAGSATFVRFRLTAAGSGTVYFDDAYAAKVLTNKEVLEDGEPVDVTNKHVKLEQSPGTTGGTTYVSDSASVWKDVPEMTKSVNVKGGKILIVFHGEVVIRVSQQVRTRVLVDGVVQSGSDRSLVQGNGDQYNYATASNVWVVTGLSDGNHTVKIQGKADITLRDRNLQLEEV